ncbi:MAG: rhodanese-like domain-containing protein, partial [Thermodesulfobacteriota bacterium]|nr:rhodanese-like domain-containing protein [Thermodesulfobacteriota bacterium]
MKRIKTKDVQRKRTEADVQLIDVRSVDSYNGWTFYHEPRGGHIHGARSLPFKWLDYIDWLDIVQSKEIALQHQVIVYGEDEHQTETVAQQFARVGYPHVSVYHDLVAEWMADDRLPMDALTNYRHLVSAGWLNELLTTGGAPTCSNRKFVLCHAYYHDRGAYEEGHIPGAIDVDTNTLESPETWNRRSPRELKETLEGLGITHDTSVILYGRFSFPDNNDPFPGSSAGHLGAIRCAFIMMYAGVKDVRVLNGGLQAWLDGGYEVTSEETAKKPVPDFGRPIPGRPELAVDLPEAKEILAAADKNL